MGMVVVVILVIRLSFGISAATRLTDVARRLFGSFELRNEAFLSGLCHDKLVKNRKRHQIKERIKEHPHDVNEVPI